VHIVHTIVDDCASCLPASCHTCCCTPSLSPLVPLCHPSDPYLMEHPARERLVQAVAIKHLVDGLDSIPASVCMVVCVCNWVGVGAGRQAARCESDGRMTFYMAGRYGTKITHVSSELYGTPKGGVRLLWSEERGATP
jgi:hypothetical protein